jgi:ABC-type transport system involved in cytochrome c biogenesis ATPase subunit
VSDLEATLEAVFEFSIPSATGSLSISTNSGASTIFVGANGGGKTRLAVLLEKSGGDITHRISAHRALNLNPAVAKISERHALAALRTGHPDEQPRIQNRPGQRWQNNEAVSLLNDFDYLLQALFAEQTNKTLETHTRNRAGDHSPAPPTNLEKLAEIWHRLLPHRRLTITGDDIRVSIPESTADYPASQMSDGERAIFYMIGQALTAAKSSLLIIDEPELHVHRSIMARLWDEIEAARQDCAIVYITHDLEFAAARIAQKFVIHAYDPTPYWKIEGVPPGTGFSEELTTLILGSRRPVLFVEGTDTSLDLPFYRACYPAYTVIPRGSCEEVLHSVVTMRRNKDLTRVTCAGVVDADDYEPHEVKALADHGVAILPVSEIENLVVLPSVSRAILEHEGYSGTSLQDRQSEIARKIFATLTSADAIEDVVVRYCRRRIDRTLKRVDLSSSANESDLAAEFAKHVGMVNINNIAQSRRERIRNAVKTGDLTSLLSIYDNKGVLAIASSQLRNTHKDALEGWLTRVLANNKAPTVVAAISVVLPKVVPR